MNVIKKTRLKAEIPYSRIRRLVLKILILSKLIYKFESESWHNIIV